MTDDKENNKPDTPPTNSGGASESQPLRKISDEELQTILEEHKKWVESSEKEGSRADLSHCDLSHNHWELTTIPVDRPGGLLTLGPTLNKAIMVGTKLCGVDLPGARLKHANLIDADLSHSQLARVELEGASAIRLQLQHSTMRAALLLGTDLSGANLSDADLTDADLNLANLTGATVARANFEKANLQKTNLTKVEGLNQSKLHDCNLCGATGLKGTEFARADITGAKLPEDLKEFKSLAVVEEISKNARKIFLAMLLGCAYAWLTILTTTDARLILNSVSSPLPIIGAEIRIAYFYYAAPVILLGLYIYLHLYLQRLWEGLSKLPAIFEDGKRLDERAYPWLLNGLVRRHFDKLKGGRSGIEKTEELVSLFLAWWVVPLTFGLFWYWYLVRHHWPGTGLHIVLISLSIACAILFYRKHADSLRGSVRPAFHWKRFYRTRTFQSMSVVALCAVVSYGAIEGLYFEMEPDRWYGDTPSWARADLREAQLSTIPPSYWSMDSAIRDDAVRGANLRGADLRYAHMQGSFLVNADLKYANLEGSNLWLSNLSNANLDSANLTGVDLTDAELPGATLRFAKLSDAELDYANLSDATMMGDTLIRAVLKATNLTDADVRNSNFDSARLTDAILIRADLRHSRFVGTVFDGAYLRGTKLAATNLTRTSGLTQVQIYQACCDTLITKLPPGLTIKQCQK